MQRLIPRAATPALVLLGLAATAAPGSARQEVRYSVERLPLPTGSKPFGALNDSGVVAASVFLAGELAAFRCADGLVERLPDPTGLSTTRRVVWGIDAAGTVVGQAQTSSGNRAVRWTAAGAEVARLPNDGYTGKSAVAPGGALAISGWPFGVFVPAWEGEYGWGTGSAGELPLSAGQDPMHIYVWRDGLVERLPTALEAGALDFGMRVDGINDAGQVALTLHVDLDPRAYLFDPEDGLRALPSLGCTVSAPYALNAHGDAAGVVRTAAGRNRPVLWRDGRALELPLPPGALHGYAVDLNDGRQVAGYAYTDFAADVRPVVWIHGRPVDLAAFLPDGSGWTLQRSFAINARGQVLVLGRARGVDELFLFTPTGPRATQGGDLR